MTDVIAGQSVALLSQWYDFSGGSLVNLDATPSIAIVNIGTGATALASTTSGVTHPGTGSYGYTWTPSSSLAAGSYLATWSGLKNGSAVTATETIVVTAPASSAAANTSPYGVWYCTREDVKRALDAKETSRTNAQIDRAIESASRGIERTLHRRFYPVAATRYKDWPNTQFARPWRVWLDADEVISVTALTAGGTTIASTDYFLEPVDSGPPYTRIEIDLSSSASFASGDTSQRAISITGLFGYTADTSPAGALAEALDASETGVDVTDSSLVGVGDIIKADSERMIVTGRGMLDTGVNIHASDSLAASKSDVSITMSTTTNAPVVDEIILIDSERMLVVDVAGSVLTVIRAWDGSVLATHAGSADIYAPRTLTVTRGVLGTTADTHSTATAITKHVVPGPVRQLTVAEVLNALMQETSGYARMIGGLESQKELLPRGLTDLRMQVYATYGRKARSRVI